MHAFINEPRRGLLYGEGGVYKISETSGIFQLLLWRWDSPQNSQMASKDTKALFASVLFDAIL
jgi:hypothetical protein